MSLTFYAGSNTIYLSPCNVSLTFYAGSTGVTYSVETSTDLKTWTTSSVTLSALDANHIRTATVPTAGANRFMRLMVSY